MLSALNICSSFQIFYPSGVLCIGAIYTPTLIAQIKANIVLVCKDLVSMVSHAPPLCSNVRVYKTLEEQEQLVKNVETFSS